MYELEVVPSNPWWGYRGNGWRWRAHRLLAKVYLSFVLVRRLPRRRKKLARRNHQHHCFHDYFFFSFYVQQRRRRPMPIHGLTATCTKLPSWSRRRDGILDKQSTPMQCWTACQTACCLYPATNRRTTRTRRWWPRFWSDRFKPDLLPSLFPEQPWLWWWWWGFSWLCYFHSFSPPHLLIYGKRMKTTAYKCVFTFNRRRAKLSLSYLCLSWRY